MRIKSFKPQLSIVILVLGLFGSLAVPAQTSVPGPITTGQTRLINNRTITPAGSQTALGEMPLNSVLAPDGKHLLVTNDGAGIQSLQVIDTATSQVIQTLPYTIPESVFIGLAYSADGKKVYASGGGSEKVHVFLVGPDGLLAPDGDIIIGTTQQNPFPTGLSLSPDGARLYVANNLTNDMAVVDTTTRQVVTSVKVGNYPYTPLVSKDGSLIYVSNWADATISVISASALQQVATIKVGDHPTSMEFGPGNLLFVSDANSDAISVVSTATNQELRRLSVSPYANAPLSSSPEGIAVSPDQKYLFVADAGADEVVVFGLNGATGPEKLLGRIPTAWYPTAVRVSLDNKQIYITNAKGQGAGPNSTGFYPNPTRFPSPVVQGVTGYGDSYCNCSFDRFAGSMINGTLSTVPMPSLSYLQHYTSQVHTNNNYNNSAVNQRNPGNPIPLPGGTSPIKHVIYIIKENRTFDQVYGDLGIGNGDPSLTLFPRVNTPNLHSLVERFGILDNFYADAEISASGHNWADSAFASDYNEKNWPQNYSPIPGRNRPYDFEGGSRVNLSAGGYLWDAAAKKGLTYRDYGEFFEQGSAASPPDATVIPESQADSCAGPIAHSYSGVPLVPGTVLCFKPSTVKPDVVPNLVGHIDPKFRTFDLRYSDQDRFLEWQREFNQFVAQGNLPQLSILQLPDDHTFGTVAGVRSPQSYLASNDYAVGRLVDAVSHSPYWKDTAIFITEDDAQNGPDHVDAHRTTSLVISAYTSRTTRYVDSTLYDTAAMVRTIELILGLNPLSQFDANAIPMWRLFKSTPDLRPYTVLPETVPLDTVNTAATFGAATSATLDFNGVDRADMGQLNRVLWGAIKGPGVPYPGEDSPAQPRKTDTDD